MKPNPGHCPHEARGKRVRVFIVRDADRANPPTFEWPADGSSGCRWSLNVGEFDIAQYEVVG